MLGANYSFVRRLQNYTLINITGNFGYTWQETQKKNWKFNPIFMTVTQVPDKYLSEAFRQKREANSYLKHTFSNNVVQGENLLFEYKSNTTGNAKRFSTVKAGLEEAGTLLRGINAVYKSFTGDSITAIAHYLKADLDYRKYYNRRKSQWANRFMIGVGLPIGQSTT